MSINSSIGWIGITASPLCYFYSSYLQQQLPNATISTLTNQARCLTILKRHGAITSYPRPPLNTAFPISVCIFADAGRVCDHGQLSCLAGILLGQLQKDSPFYPVWWMSHKSRRPVKSIASAEILAVGEAVDEGKCLKDTMIQLLGIKIELIVVTDSKDLYNSLSTQRNATDRSVRADVNVIRYELETNSVDHIVWIPGRVNLADPDTKRDSALCDSLQLLFYTGKIPLDLAEAEVRSTNRPLG